MGIAATLYPSRIQTATDWSSIEKLVAKEASWQLGVFRLGGEEYRDIWVSVFPEREEVLVSGAGFGVVSFKDIGAREVQLGQGIEWPDRIESPMLENLLKFASCLAGVLQLKISDAADVK